MNTCCRTVDLLVWILHIHTGFQVLCQHMIILIIIATRKGSDNLTSHLILVCTTLVSCFTVSLYCHHCKLFLEWSGWEVHNRNKLTSGCIQNLQDLHKEIHFYFAIHEADILSCTILSSQSQSPPLLLRSTNVDWAPNVHWTLCARDTKGGWQGSCSWTDTPYTREADAIGDYSQVKRKLRKFFQRKHTNGQSTHSHHH